MKSREIVSRITVFTILMLLLIAPAAAAPTVLFDGTVTLTKDATFTQVAYTSALSYTVEEDTPLGALHAAATSADTYTDFTYDVTDSQWVNYNVKVLLLDNVDGYTYKNPGKWYAYVNDVFKDGYGNEPNGLNVIELVDGDKVEFYYASGIATPSDLAAVKAAATAAVLTVADIQPPDYPVAQFTATPPLTGLAPLTVQFVDQSTGLAPLSYAWDFQNDGIIDSIAQSPSFTYNTVGKYTVNLTVTNSLSSDAEVKKDYVNVITMPTDWTLELSGARDESITRSYFESGLACSQSGHQVFWTDGDGNTWGGVPLWFLAGMVDDSPDVGPLHYNFNDTIAAKNYQVNVIGSDGTTATLDSARIARNNNIIVANTLNDAPLPLTTPSGKPSWPLHLKGSDVLTGEQIGDIARIELTNLPVTGEAWTLEMVGQVGDRIPKSEFEAGLACPASGHQVEWTDSKGAVWSGVPLWVLLGSVDDIETSGHWTFSDTVAGNGYTVKVWAGDGFYNRTFTSAAIARNNGYIVANKKDGAELTAADGYPLKLIGPAVTSGKDKVGAIAKIEIVELQTPPPAPGSYVLTLKGKITDVLSQAEIEQGLACPQSGHQVEWTQVITNTDGSTETHVWSGIPLWFLAGWVDDRQPHDFNNAQAAAGYKIVVKSADGFSKTFSIADVAGSQDYIVANRKDGAPLTYSSPLQLVGPPLTKTGGALGGLSVKNLSEIELIEFGVVAQAPKLHIVKYDTDGTTIVKEVTIDYHYMEDNLPVIGDGVTSFYVYQGLTMDPNDLWDPTETKGMNPPKVNNTIKGTKIKDLVDLVGGMGTGTDIIFIASDGYETKLGYSNIYTNPYVQSHQGDAVLAWYADGKYVPEYAAGMRTFFTPADHVFGQWNMHEALDSKYWHYNWQGGVQYPSAAGTSNQNVVEIKVYSSPATDWQILLDGSRIGGMSTTISRTYLEQALACQFGSNHKASYTDNKGRVWEGMPLWFFAGFVDDADPHSNAAFNDTLAKSGYRIIITGAGGYTSEIDSPQIIRSSSYIVANSLNGMPIPDSDENWPLRLTGAGVSGSATVKGITKIELVPYETPAPEFPTPAFPVLIIITLAFIVMGSRRKF
jgi:PKD repeat protein